MEKVEGFRKLTENPYGDLYWNLPEAKQGWLNVVGGNKERFHAPVSIANSIREKWPVEKVVTILPVGATDFSGFSGCSFRRFDGVGVVSGRGGTFAVFRGGGF